MAAGGSTGHGIHLAKTKYTQGDFLVYSYKLLLTYLWAPCPVHGCVLICSLAVGLSGVGYVWCVVCEHAKVNKTQAGS